MDNIKEYFEDTKLNTNNNASSGMLTGLTGIYTIGWLIISLIWFIGGITAFIASIVCMFYTSTVTDKAIGLLLAIIIGPFYWLYYIYNSVYCTPNIPVYNQNYYQ